MNESNPISHSEKPLTPYEALVATTYYLSRQLGGSIITVNYADVGLIVEKDSHGPHAGKEKYFKAQALNINGAPWIIGVLAPDFSQRNKSCAVYGFSYDWTKVLERAQPGSRPRLMPPEEPNYNYFVNLFSDTNHYLVNENGLIKAAESIGTVVDSKKITRIVRNNLKSIDDKIYYQPNAPLQLAPTLYRSFVNMQTISRRPTTLHTPPLKV